MSNKIYKPYLDKSSGVSSSEYIGNKGEIFFDPNNGAVKLSNGLTPGGTTITLETDDLLVSAALTNYETSVDVWNGFMSSEVYQDGHPWFKWNVNGETADEYLTELQAGWDVQNTPSSPPSQLIFLPAISAAYYNQLRTALQYVRAAYINYLQILQAKRISGDSLTVPEVLQTTPEEDLVVRLRVSVPSSPPGSTAYMTRDFTYGVNGSITFPNGTTQTGAAISRAELKSIVESSADFAAFKAAMAAL